MTSFDGERTTDVLSDISFRYETCDFPNVNFKLMYY